MSCCLAGHVCVWDGADRRLSHPHPHPENECSTALPQPRPSPAPARPTPPYPGPYLTLTQARPHPVSPPLAGRDSGVGSGLETQGDLGTAVGREGGPGSPRGQPSAHGTGPGPSTTRSLWGPARPHLLDWHQLLCATTAPRGRLSPEPRYRSRPQQDSSEYDFGRLVQSACTRRGASSSRAPPALAHPLPGPTFPPALRMRLAFLPRRAARPSPGPPAQTAPSGVWSCRAALTPWWGRSSGRLGGQRELEGGRVVGVPNYRCSQPLGPQVWGACIEEHPGCSQ